MLQVYIFCLLNSKQNEQHYYMYIFELITYKQHTVFITLIINTSQEAVVVCSVCFLKNSSYSFEKKKTYKSDNRNQYINVTWFGYKDI